MILSTAQKLYNLGFKIMATAGTSQFLDQAGFPNQKVNKVREGRPHVVDLMKNGEIQLVINTTIGSKSVSESYFHPANRSDQPDPLYHHGGRGQGHGRGD